MKYYFPYPSDKPEKKYYIITKDNKRVSFGQAFASDFTKHKNKKEKNYVLIGTRKMKIGLNQE